MSVISASHFLGITGLFHPEIEPDLTVDLPRSEDTAVPFRKELTPDMVNKKFLSRVLQRSRINPDKLLLIRANCEALPG